MGLKLQIRDLVDLLATARRLRGLMRFVRTPHIEPIRVAADWSLLVLAPHPDDESIWCGGLVRRVVEAGGAVDVLFLTDGGAGVPGAPRLPEPRRGELVAQRREEARRACELLGVRRHDHLDAEDGGLGRRSDLVEHLLARLEEGRHRQIACPWPFDRQPHPEATFELLRLAAPRFRALRTVLLYEAWTPLIPNAAISIDAVLDIKNRAIAQHRSQAEHEDFVEKSTGLARYRSLCLPHAKHAEAYVALPSSQLDLLRS